MIPFTEIESLLILCFYKFDRARNTKAFLTRFNDYFGKDIGEQTLQYEMIIGPIRACLYEQGIFAWEMPWSFR